MNRTWLLKVAGGVAALPLIAIVVSVIASIVTVEDWLPWAGDPAGIAALISTRLNALLVVVTTLYLLATLVIAWTSLQSSKQAASSAEAAKESSEISRASLDEMRIQAAATRDSATAAWAALDQMKEQSTAAQDSATAAQQTAKEMAAQRTAAMRPYVVFTAGHKPEFPNPRPWEFNLVVRNVGHGPALDLRATVVPDPDSLPLLIPYGWSVVYALPSGETERISVRYAQYDFVYPVEASQYADRQRLSLMNATAKAAYVDVEGHVWLTECRVAVGPPDYLPDRRNNVPGEFPVSILPGTHRFGEISELPQVPGEERAAEGA
jgi:hypothetical protein